MNYCSHKSEYFQDICARYDGKVDKSKTWRKEGHVLHITGKATWGKTLKTLFKDNPKPIFVI